MVNHSYRAITNGFRHRLPVSLSNTIERRSNCARWHYTPQRLGFISGEPTSSNVLQLVTPHPYPTTPHHAFWLGLLLDSVRWRSPFYEHPPTTHCMHTRSLSYSDVSLNHNILTYSKPHYEGGLPKFMGAISRSSLFINQRRGECLEMVNVNTYVIKIEMVVVRSIIREINLYTVQYNRIPFYGRCSYEESNPTSYSLPIQKSRPTSNRIYGGAIERAWTLDGLARKPIH